jgi:DNA-binding transcriptional LysR family regulator
LEEKLASKLTLEALEVLDAIDRKGSFAAAAAALYRVPSAVTYTVQKLEEDLGVVLFRKEGRRSILTPAGKVLLEQGRSLLEAAERLVETTRQVDTGWESCLNISIDSIFEFSYVYELLEEFYEIKPDIEVNLYEDVLGGAWESIIDGRADIVIGAPEPDVPTQGLRFEKFQVVDFVFAVAANHPLLGLEKVSEEMVREYRGVVVKDTAKDLPPLTRRVFDKQAVIRVPSVSAKIEAQVKGLGVGFLPRHRIQGLLQSGELVEVSVEKEIPLTTQVYTAWRMNNKGKALRWFVEKLS